MRITHHLGAETLLSYAAGSLPSALAAVAGAHIAMCARCCHELSVCELIGASLLDALPPSPLAAPVPAPPKLPSGARPAAAAVGGHAANPILRLMRENFASVAWRRVGIGLWHQPLPLQGRGSLHLIKAAPGAAVPDHGHSGGELTLILSGALSDFGGRYAPGDVADLDAQIEHTPAADAASGCICAVANEGPSRFRGLLARLWQPWHGL
jgi:putative transcriptional regulator